MTVAVLTDSTACLPAERAAAAGVTVLPLHVVVGRRSLAEGVEIGADEVAALLGRGKEPVSTSRPAPGEFVQAYRGLAARTGCEAIVSVHLSAAVSGTVDSARLAAAAVRQEVQVEVVDARVLGMALGYAACTAAQVAAAGGTVQEVADAARQRASATSTLLYVDTLEHLRRGGRVGAAAALVGSALAIKPLLTVADGTIGLSERVRTRAKAMARLEERSLAAAREAVERASAGDDAAGDDAAHGQAAQPVVDVAVHHLAWAEPAEQLVERLAAELGDAAQVDLVELGAVVAVHTGPKTLAVVVAPR